jgi:hypothetical protein
MFALSAFNPVDTLTKSQNGGDILDKALFSAALNAVRYVAQTLTTAQQLQARTNIGAAQSPTSRTRTVLTSSSGTYVTPAGCKAIFVRMLGGGGGAAGGDVGGGAGGVGGSTTFGASLLVAGGGGNGGTFGNAPAAGGSASGGDINVPGNPGMAWGPGAASPVLQGAPGGVGPFGGAGSGGWPSGGTPSAGFANSGSGGGGGGASGSGHGGNSGASGGYVEKFIVNPLATYAFAVGAGGAPGSAGGSGASAGGPGGSGIIIIDEFY